jgi:peroxiredoxin
MRSLQILFIVLALAVAAFAQQGVYTGSIAPSFALAGLDGQTYDLSQLRGKIVLVTFWSTRCNICHSEMPKMNSLADRYKGQNVVFLGLTMDNDQKVASYLKSNMFEFTIVPNSFGAVLQYADRDKDGNINMGFPAYYLIDQNGVIRLKTNGWDKTQDLDATISRLLAGPRVMVASGPREMGASAISGQK